MQHNLFLRETTRKGIENCEEKKETSIFKKHKS